MHVRRLAQALLSSLSDGAQAQVLRGSWNQVSLSRAHPVCPRPPRAAWSSRLLMRPHLLIRALCRWRPPSKPHAGGHSYPCLPEMMEPLPQPPCTSDTPRSWSVGSPSPQPRATSPFSVSTGGAGSCFSSRAAPHCGVSFCTC